MKHPDNWTYTQTGNQLTFTSPYVGNQGQYIRQFPPIDNETGVIPGSGDGYHPIPHYTPAFKRIYAVNHHASPGAQSVKCYDVSTETTCDPANTTNWPQQLPDGDPNNSAFSPTASGNEEFQVVNDKLYYASTRGNEWGLGCYDLISFSECGFTIFSNNPNGSSVTIGIEGPFKVGSKLYLLDVDTQVHCFDTQTNAACTNFSVNLTLPEITNATTLTAGHIGGQVVGNKIYFSVSYNHSSVTPNFGNKQVQCFDTVTNAICAGWGSPAVIPGGERNDNFSNFTYYNGLTPIAYCIRERTVQSCVDLDDPNIVVSGSSGSIGSIQSTPIQLVSPSTTLPLGLGGEIEVKNINAGEHKTYFPNFFGKDIYCFDWINQTSCGAPTAPSNPNANENYAGTIDPYGCGWFNGHSNVVWSFDPVNNQTPCKSLQLEDSFEPNYCTGGTWKWESLEIRNITDSDFTFLQLELLDQSGNVITTETVSGPTFNLNISGAPYDTMQQIRYRITSRLNVGAGVSQYTTTPEVVINYDGSPEEFCFQTQYDCPVESAIENTAQAWIQGESGFDNESTVTLDSEQACRTIDTPLCEFPQGPGTFVPGFLEVHTAGTRDNFVGIEPTYRSADLQAFIVNNNPNPDRQFDDTPNDRIFGHTFFGLPSNPEYARLEISMIPNGQNDSFFLQAVPGATPLPFAWGIALSNITTISGLTELITLDLQNLPTSGSYETDILDRISGNRLDVLIEDDTAIDYLELTILKCPDIIHDFSTDRVFEQDLETLRAGLGHLSSSLFDTSQDGHGLSMEVLDDSSALLTWYNYDQTGKQRWMLGVGSISGTTVTANDMQIATGGIFGDNFDPSSVSRENWGDVTITFDSCNSASMQFESNDGTESGTLNLSRLTNLDGLKCELPANASTQAIPTEAAKKSGTFFDPSHDGEGTVIQILENNSAVVYW
ncbi:MAG: hypothetical protein K0U68_16245, partial [Gammaproteobacteria bacterium]|nr:hypothetical protein [Gammaproteobacteria bacterium]